MGALSRGSGTTPTLLGFGDDEHKLVLISDADRNGTNLVGFWRDEFLKITSKSRVLNPDESLTKSVLISLNLPSSDQLLYMVTESISKTQPGPKRFHKTSLVVLQPQVIPVYHLQVCKSFNGTQRHVRSRKNGSTVTLTIEITCHLPTWPASAVHGSCRTKL